MTSKVSGFGRLAAGLPMAGLGLAVAAQAFAEDFGHPVDGAIGMTGGVTDIKREVIFFHNVILMPIITVITLFVLGLLLWCVFRYNKRANPTPARFSHNTFVEIVWTVVPVLILMGIAIFSFRLLYEEHAMPKPDLTVKATGYQWQWGYSYPDQKIDEFYSKVLPEKVALERGVPYRLAADTPLVVPVNKTVRVLVTGSDVIHAFAMPSFGIKIDAIPGKVNQTWFKADRVGVYYGQCSELCGIDHAFMPIEVHVVSQADFDAWVASKAPKPAGAPPATVAAASPAPAAAGAAPATTTR